MNLIERKKRVLDPVNCRKIQRNFIKNSVGNNNISSVWKNIQLNYYGFSKYCHLYHQSCHKPYSRHLLPVVISSVTV